MKQIPEADVRKVWRQMNDMTRREGAQLAEDLAAEQPGIAAYLLGVDEDIFNDDERSLLFYLSMTVWQIMKQGDTPLPAVPIEDIQKAESSNVNAVDQLSRVSPMDAKSILQEMVVGYSQPDVLASVLIALMQPHGDKEDEPGEGVREENLGMLLLDVKTVIDVLNG